MTPNSNIQALIKSMGIFPESEHYEIAERVAKECMDIAQEYDGAKLSGPGLIIAMRIERHFGVEQ